MSVLSCPACGSYIKSYEKYFCTTCGKRLAYNSTIETKSVPLPINKIPIGETTHTDSLVVSSGNHFFKKLYLAYILIFIVLLGLISLFYTADISKYLKFFKQLDKAENQSLTISQPNAHVVTTTLDLTAKKLSRDGISKYAPFESVLYFEAYDARKIFDLYLSSKAPKYSKDISNLYPLAGDALAFFVADNYWVLLVEKNDTVSEVTFKSQEGLAFGVVDNYYYLSDSEDAYKNIVFSKEKIAKNFGMTPHFVTQSVSLGETKIKAFVYAKDNEYLNQLGLIGFSNKEVLDKITSINLSYFAVL